MKDITKKEVDELLSIIPRNYPLLDLYHITESCNELCQALDTLTMACSYNYDLFIPEKFYEHEVDKNSHFKIQKFDFKKHRYNTHARQYDFVFIMIELANIENRALFYKKLHAIIKNGGKILFIVKTSEDLRALEDELIEYNYVAVNPIENTFKNYQILSAQKMHGWGN